VAFSVAALVFLMAPVLVVIPLAFNAEPDFTDPIEHAARTRWFVEFFTQEVWRTSVRNSFVIALAATAIATALGTLAAVGLAQRNLPGRALITAILVSPMICAHRHRGGGGVLLLLHAGHRQQPHGHHPRARRRRMPSRSSRCRPRSPASTTRSCGAARMLGASPFTAFRRVTLPIIWPGVFSGALFAFATSFDAGGGGAVPGQRGAAHHPAPDVDGPARAARARLSWPRPWC
jgi:putative spermidine/putrescine transport system permease protein